MKRNSLFILIAIMAISLWLVNTPLAKMMVEPLPPAPLKIIAFGDSLTAGLGLPLQDAFPAQLESKLKEKGYNVHVINAGVSGETTSGGLTRLEWVLQQKPDAVIVELSANDMLRGLDIKGTQGNLEKMLYILERGNYPVLLCGMRAFRNMGAQADNDYVTMFKSLAEKYHVLLYPFFLEGVAMKPELNQEDGLHPTAQGVAIIVDKLLPDVEKLLKQIKKEK